MKKLILFLFLCSSVAFAQKSYKKSLQGVKKVRIESGADITVVAGTTNQLIIEEIHEDSGDRHRDRFPLRNEDSKKKKSRKDGLRAIYPGGEDNTDGFGFSITTENGVLVVKDLKSHFQREDIKVTLPKTMNIDVDSGNLGGIVVDGFSSEVEADANVGEITLKNVTGPITAHTSTGTISVVFTKVNQSAPITISSSVGEIDVALPASTKANLNIRTNGTVYTNFDFKAPPKKGLPNRSGLKNIEKALNGGGVKIKLKSSMGNIYLRKN
ncbi:DUF4097 family beta strand repeat-containing protein [Pseudotenacibaculum haliotis]|uniref:DUF4097 family beta strand repeat-containing protein n=1 Tax=Pseudotenacibaculum haliotis TaxID=1862138 RepID=A0ABW5LPI5_9FLAO